MCFARLAAMRREWLGYVVAGNFAVTNVLKNTTPSKRFFAAPGVV